MNIGILGCGAYGISLAVNLIRNNSVTMWTALEEEKDLIEKTRYNNTLKNVYINKNIDITTNIEDIMKNEIIIISIPVKFMESTINKIKPYINNQIIINTSKGIVNKQFIYNYLKDNLNTNNIGILSGGTLAKDLAQSCNCGLTIAGNQEIREITKRIFNLNYIKIDETEDIQGVEIISSVKNTMAILMGIIDNQSNTTKAYMLNNIIIDIKNIINILNGNINTIYNYAGLSDILVTCLSNSSRNYTYGNLLREDKNKAQEFLENNTVEGYNTLIEIYKILKEKDHHIKSIDNLYKIIINNENTDILLK